MSDFIIELGILRNTGHNTINMMVYYLRDVIGWNGLKYQ